MDQIEFQLKLHTLQQSILIKQSQLQVVEAKLDKVGSIRIESQDEILQLITNVHKTIKNVELIVLQIKDPCYQLQMNSLYDLFRNVSYTMFNAVRLLADGCQNGVQRNLFKYAPAPKNQVVNETQCVEEASDECINQIRTELKQKQQFNSDTRAQLQINRIYMSVEAQKQAVMKTFPSNVVTKLNQVRQNWIKIIDDSDKILQEAYNRENEGKKQNLTQKLHKPQYVTKVLKEELFQTIKSSFKNTVQKTLKKMYSLFYQTQYQKLKKQMQGPKTLKKQVEVQTQIQGMNKIKQVQKQRKHYEKVLKQLQELKCQKNRINQEYIIAAGNNQIYISRIHELESKLMGYGPINQRSLDRRNSQQKISQFLRRNSIKQTRQSIFVQKDKQDPQNLQFNSKFNLIYNQNQTNHSSKGLIIKSDEEGRKSDESIIKKRYKLKRVYAKSRLNTQQCYEKRDLLSNQIKNPFQANKHNQSITEVKDGGKQREDLQKIHQNSQNESIDKQIQSLNSQQLKTAVTQIHQFTEQVKKSHNFNINSQIKQSFNLKNIIQNNDMANKQQKDQQNSIKQLQNTSFNSILPDRIVLNTSIKGFLSEFLKKVIVRSDQQITQHQGRPSINLKSQTQSQQKFNRGPNQNLKKFPEQESSQKIKETKVLYSQQNMKGLDAIKNFNNKLGHSKQQSSLSSLKPKNIKQEKKIVLNRQNNNYYGKNLKKMVINHNKRQVLQKRIETENGFISKIETQTQEYDTNNHKRDVIIQNSYQKRQIYNKTSSNKRFNEWKNNNMFQNLNISQFNNNLLRVKLKQTLSNTISSINCTKILDQKLKNSQKFEQSNLNQLISIKPMKIIQAKQKKCLQKNKITKDIIQICKTLLKKNCNSQLQNVLGHYIQVNLINPVGIVANDQIKRNEHFKNRMQTL